MPIASNRKLRRAMPTISDVIEPVPPNGATYENKAQMQVVFASDTEVVQKRFKSRQVPAE